MELNHISRLESDLVFKLQFCLGYECYCLCPSLNVFFFSVLGSDTYFSFVSACLYCASHAVRISPIPNCAPLCCFLFPSPMVSRSWGVSSHPALLLVLPHSFLPGKPLFQLCKASSAASPASLVPPVLITSATVSTSPLLLSSGLPC